MYENPASLQQFCVDFIASQIEDICVWHSDEENDFDTCRFLNNKDIGVHPDVADEVLESICEKKKLDNSILTLFQNDVLPLRKAHIRNVLKGPNGQSVVTYKGLQVLKSHKLLELEVIGLKNITASDLVNCLSEFSISNLRLLNLMKSCSYSTWDLRDLSKLRNIQVLNVSYSNFNARCLSAVVECMPSLSALDISVTNVNDLSALQDCTNLKSLSMYSLLASHCEHMVDQLCQLSKLRHLDISESGENINDNVEVASALQKLDVSDLLQNNLYLCNLVSLDISGKDGIMEKDLEDFFQTHPNLKFVGLACTNASDFTMFNDECGSEINLQISGYQSESMIMECLKRYLGRAPYIQKALYHLFNLTQGLDEPRLDMIKLIISAMREHIDHLGVQMAATACLYNLSKSELGTKIHPCWLGKIVTQTLNSMESFPTNQQLQKNALLTLCSDRILQDVKFDHYRCAKLVMECLCLFEEISMNRMSAAIISILAAKIPTEKTSHLGTNKKYMEKFLNIVDEKQAIQSSDITMRFTLSALWNLTDESPATCVMFLDIGGLELFLKVLEAYKDVEPSKRTQVETKILGLINNLAEVKELRHTLMTNDVVVAMQNALKSEHIDVSYFAAGIISHLVTEGETFWTVEVVTREQMLTTLGEAVRNWEQPETEMVAYRSFNPFFPLLTHFDTPQIQLWAVWAMQHVCSKNGARYCPMLINEGGVSRLLELAQNPKTNQEVSELAYALLETVSNQQRNKCA